MAVDDDALGRFLHLPREFEFEDVENDELLKIIKRFSRLYFTQIFGFSLMGR